MKDTSLKTFTLLNQQNHVMCSVFLLQSAVAEATTAIAAVTTIHLTMI